MFSSSAGRGHDPLAPFSADVREALRRFRHGDLAALEPILSAIVREFMPGHDRTLAGTLPADAALVEDLGLDSLAVAEAVFFMEDLFAVRISNEEILRVRTVSDLQTFILAKTGAAPAVAGGRGKSVRVLLPMAPARSRDKKESRQAGD
ncbi:MAG TPA: acyl carrier protein [Opitutaceae bacterium]|nr:acyl carrier protein [Opitutaceae bacterium]